MSLHDHDKLTNAELGEIVWKDPQALFKLGVRAYNGIDLKRVTAGGVIEVKEIHVPANPRYAFLLVKEAAEKGLNIAQLWLGQHTLTEVKIAKPKDAHQAINGAAHTIENDAAPTVDPQSAELERIAIRLAAGSPVLQHKDRAEIVALSKGVTSEAADRIALAEASPIASQIKDDPKRAARFVASFVPYADGEYAGSLSKAGFVTDETLVLPCAVTAAAKGYQKLVWAELQQALDFVCAQRGGVAVVARDAIDKRCFNAAYAEALASSGVVIR